MVMPEEGIHFSHFLALYPARGRLLLWRVKSLARDAGGETGFPVADHAYFDALRQFENRAP